MGRRCKLCCAEITEVKYDDSWCRKCRRVYDWNVLMLRKEGITLTAAIGADLKAGRWHYRPPYFGGDRHPCMTKW